MKDTSRHVVIGNVLLLLILGTQFLHAQNSDQKKILIDVSHGEKFWHDPAAMQGMDPQFIERVKYMTAEIKKSAASNGAGIDYVRGKISSKELEGADILFIHIPSSKFDTGEVAAVKQYVQNGGGLFLVMDVDYWSTLEQTNVNDIVTPFGLRFEGAIPDSLSGGYSKAGPITPQPRKVTYHGARIVKGGTPFCFSNQSNTTFGAFTELPKGGKVISMGDGMVSLYMTSWNGVEDYQCQEFMTDAIAWLLR